MRGKDKLATMSPQVTETPIQKSHHVDLLVTIPTSYETEAFHQLISPECHLEHNKLSYAQ